jgi:hypothetical protein
MTNDPRRGWRGRAIMLQGGHHHVHRAGGLVLRGLRCASIEEYGEANSSPRLHCHIPGGVPRTPTARLMASG